MIDLLLQRPARLQRVGPCGAQGLRAGAAIPKSSRAVGVSDHLLHSADAPTPVGVILRGGWPVEITTSQCGGIPMIVVRGDVDHAAQTALAEAARAALGADGDRILFDLKDCPYMDSGGLSVLLSLLRRAGQGGFVGVISPGPNLLRIFEIVGLTADARFRVFADRAGRGTRRLTWKDSDTSSTPQLATCASHCLPNSSRTHEVRRLAERLADAASLGSESRVRPQARALRGSRQRDRTLSGPRRGRDRRLAPLRPLGGRGHQPGQLPAGPEQGHRTSVVAVWVCP